MLTERHCALFDIPFYQFAQLKKHQPETIPQIKADYKAAWRDWQSLILQVSHKLGEPFAPPHIERWCNGWQVRAHFFAYFKYAPYTQSAAIFSILLNRRRLSVSLDWHSYKASISPISLSQYNQWPEALDKAAHADLNIWHGGDSEYDDYRTMAQTGIPRPKGAQDFYRIGGQIERADLAQTDSVSWITQTIHRLQPLYEACFD
ncbi:MAG: HI_0552 family protein [Neisseria sp.]|nr:HI_0552 family protein [Neisseria sp.]